MEARIEAIHDSLLALIQALDATEADPDFEPYLADSTTDREGGDAGDERESDKADDEPSLGWTEMEARSGRYASTFEGDDREDDDPAEDADPTRTAATARQT